MQAATGLIRTEHIRFGPQGPEVFGEAAAVLQAFALIEHVEHGRPRQRRDYQDHHLAALLAHARAHSPFWRARLKPGVTALDRLPVLDRKGLRAQAEAEGALPLPPEHGEAVRNKTSGATSEPVFFHVSTFNGSYNQARYAFDDLNGGRRLDLPLTFMGRTIERTETLDRWPSLTGRIWRTGGGVMMPMSLLDAEAIAETLLAGPGGHIVIRPAILEVLLRHARAQARPLPPFADILTYGETVDDRLREAVRQVLGAQVTDRYSCEEAGPVAFECRRAPGHHHVCASNVMVEVVDERRRPVPEGVVGDVLLTGLHTLASPIIRYDVGDRAALLGACPCGHRGPVLRQLLGRRKSLLRLPDGRLTFFYVASDALTAAAPVREWRVSQTGRTALRLEIAAPRPLTETECEALRDVARGSLFQDFAVEIREVPRIDWGESGKRLLVVNLLEDSPP